MVVVRRWERERESSERVRAYSNLVLEQEQAAEEAVQVGCQQGEVHRCGAGSFDYHWHEAIQAKHTRAESNVQQPWEDIKSHRHIGHSRENLNNTELWGLL